MLDVNAGVDDVRAGAGAGAGVVHVRGLVGGAVGDAGKTPGDVGLRDGLVDGVDGVLLDVVDLELLLRRARCVGLGCGTHLGQVLDGLEGRAAQVGGKAPELAVAVDVVGPDPLDGVQERGLRRTILELYDVAARDKLGCAGLDHRRRKGQGQQACQGEVMHCADAELLKRGDG